MGRCGRLGLCKAHLWVAVPILNTFMGDCRCLCLFKAHGWVYLSRKHLWMGVTI